jgi:protein-arginine kinase
MKENFDKNLIPTQRLEDEEAKRIISQIKKEFPETDIDFDSEYFIIKQKENGKNTEHHLLKRKYIQTTDPENPKKEVEEIIKEIISKADKEKEAA